MLTQLKKLTSSKTFKEFQESNPKSYLSSCFTLIKDEEKPIWQFHYYNKQEDTITTFKVDNQVTKIEDSEIFKKEKESVAELKIDDIKIDLSQALKAINLQEKYKNQEFNKKIIILQSLDHPIWNISLLTNNFQILNVRINAISGNIEKETFESLMNFKQ